MTAEPRGGVSRAVRAALLLLVIATLATACHGGGGGDSVTLTAVNPSVGRAVFRLRCNPPEGDVPRPAEACAALERREELLRAPEPFTCFGGTFSWWDVEIEGHWGGRDLRTRVSTCWTPQMALIRVLGIGRALDAHVVPGSEPAYPGSGIMRAQLARIVDVPSDAPGWLVRIARRQARALGDERPDVLRIRLGDPHVIRLVGDFVCTRCSRPAGGAAPGGSHARIDVDPRTRIVDSFSLRR